MTDPEDEPAAFGAVVDADRGALPYALIHGQPLVAASAWGMEAAGITTVDLASGWNEVRRRGSAFVLHDALCPMTPPDFLARCLARAREADGVVVGVRPVTDTVKLVREGFVGQTLDRADLVAVCSPVALPPRVVAGLERPPGPDLAGLVGSLARRYPVEQLEAPAAARRVRDEDELALLAALTEPSR
jgi:2-C-methyl-D-erythritol 4-phosphate cytidylyltransferase